MLQALKVNGPVSCLLDPPHAASLRVALDMTDKSHSIVTLAPDLHALAVLLCCDDFSTEIGQHRAWFAWGDRWADELENLLGERRGLPTPSQFIRLPVSEPEVLDPIIATAQAAFSAVLKSRSIIARQMRDAWKPRSPGQLRRLCVLTHRQFAVERRRLFVRRGDESEARTAGG